jgi:hypothetical protein
LRLDAISTTPTNSDIRPPAASVPRPCQTILPAPTCVTSAPRLLSVKLPSPSTSPHICPPTNVPFPVRHADEDSLTSPICAPTNARTISDESRNTSANTAICDPTGYKISPVIPSSYTTAQASMRKSPATCQGPSPGGLLSLFLKTRSSPSCSTNEVVQSSGGVMKPP